LKDIVSLQKDTALKKGAPLQDKLSLQKDTALKKAAAGHPVWVKLQAAKPSSCLFLETSTPSP